MVTSNSSFEIFHIENHWILNEEKRIDANFYAKDVIASMVLLRKLKKKKIKVTTIGNVTKKIFYPGRFTRQLVHKKLGNPFLTPSEVFMFLPASKKFIIDYPEELDIDTNWLLLTRSGSVGRCLITTKLLKKFVLSDDLIRIVPEKDIGYIYAYLSTKMGQTFLTKDQYGATVKHIEPMHVNNIPIPYIPGLVQIINQKILISHKLKEDAQNIILTVENMIFDELGLPEIEENNLDYYGGKKGNLIKSFSIDFNELDLRLDAPYHEPLVKNLKNNLFDADIKVVKLSKLVKDIFIPTRFKRAYVNNDKEGTIFLSGTNLIEFSPLDIKYLWNEFRKIDDYRVYESNILISARGTVGRPYYVTDILDSATASDNVMRCVVNEKILSSYLTAYLLSPYAYYQIQAQKAGSVQDLLQPIHLENIYVPVPSIEIQKRIGDLILKAYTNRDEANKIEKEAIKLLENKITEIGSKN